MDESAVDVAETLCTESALEEARERFIRFRCGICLICTEGECSLTTGGVAFSLRRRMGLIFVTGTILHVAGCSPDFRIRMLLFPKERFLNAVMPLDTSMFNCFHSNPLHIYPEPFPAEPAAGIGSETVVGGTAIAEADSIADVSAADYAWRGINLWMDMAVMLFGCGRQTGSGRQMCFAVSPDLRVQEEHDFLQGLFLWMSRSLKVAPLSKVDDKSRMLALCHRFLALVHEYAATEHGVDFYSGRLCITPRYLNRITVKYVDGQSPKKIIDDQLVAEIKVRLCDPSLSVTEIAADLNFSDQTYMSAFFRRMTGMSPIEYRRSVIG